MAQDRGFKAHKSKSDEFTYKWTIAKETGDGERTAVEVVANPEDLIDKVTLAYGCLDGRLVQHNHRIADAQLKAKEYPPEVHDMVHRVIDIAHGRQPIEDRIPKEAFDRPRVVEESQDAQEAE